MPSPSRKRQVSASAETPGRKVAAVDRSRRRAPTVEEGTAEETQQSSEVQQQQQPQEQQPQNRYDSEEDDVNDVIANLALPEPRIQVAIDHSNETAGNQGVQAYAKLAGATWTYYVQSLRVEIGRSSDDTAPGEVDIDLGPAKVVSRRHASIQYNTQDRYWELTVSGRNGVRIDKVAHKTGTIRLYSGNVLDVGGVQMMFVLPDVRPTVAPAIRRSIERAKALVAAGQQSGGAHGGVVERSGAGAHHQHSRTLSHDFKAEDVGQPLHMAAPGASAVGAHIQIHTMSVPGGGQAVAATAGVPAATVPGTGAGVAYPRGVAMISRPQIRGVANSNQYIDQDLSLDEAKDIKPPYSYATMISQAILSREDQMMSLADIYDWISKQYAFYRHSKSGWQNSIRHNLSLNKAFEKVPRKQNEPGKGSKWQITPKYRDEFIKKAMQGKHIKGVSRSVPRQNQLQLKGIYDPQQHQQQQPQQQQQQQQPMGQAFMPQQAQFQHQSIQQARQLQSQPQMSEGVLDRQPSLGPPSLPPIRTKTDEAKFETPQKGVAMERNGSDFMTVGSPVSSPGYPTQLVAYTPDRGGGSAARAQDSAGAAKEGGDTNDGSANENDGKSGGGQTASATTANTAAPAPMLGITPARQASLQLAPPSSAQQRELPSSFMPGSSPAPFWKLMQLSTPVRGNDYSPSKFSSPPVTSQGERHDGDETLGDLKDVDLAKHIGNWKDNNNGESPEKLKS